MTSRSVRIVALVGWVLAACGGGASPGEHDAEPAACDDSRADYAAILATLDQSCTSDGQCSTIGATDTCDCYAVISGHCEGYPYRADSLTLEQRNTLAELTDEYRLHRCGEDHGICDCAPQEVYCGAGTCRIGRDVSCFPPSDPDAEPPDASPLDAEPPDASL